MFPGTHHTPSANQQTTGVKDLALGCGSYWSDNRCQILIDLAILSFSSIDPDDNSNSGVIYLSLQWPKLNKPLLRFRRPGFHNHVLEWPGET